MNAERENDKPARSDQRWKRIEKLTLTLMLVWAGITLGLPFFARELGDVSLFGWPLSFYMAAQGAPVIFFLIVVAYAWRTRRDGEANKESRHDA